MNIRSKFNSHVRAAPRGLRALALAPQSPSPRPRGAAAILGLVLFAAALLRLYRADRQLWLDEVSALMGSIRRPVSDILTEWPGGGTHVLFEVMAHAATAVLGESPFAVRLPAIVFGVAGVGALYLLAARILGRRSALVVSGLLAASYHHVFYSQNARGYTTLICLFLVASDLFVQFRDAGRVSIPAGGLYVVTVALCSYATPFGVFILPAHLITAAATSLLDRLRARRASFPFLGFVVCGALAGLLAALLYAPFLLPMLQYARMNAATPAEGPRLDFWLVTEILEGLQAGLLGSAGLAAASAVAAIGLLRWYQLHAYSLAVLVVPLAIEGGTFLVMGVGMHPRYFSIALPVVLIAGGCGLVTLLDALCARAPIPGGKSGALSGALLASIVVLSAVPLLQYYRIPKQDFLGALRTLESVAAPGDTKVAVQVAASVLRGYYGADVVRVDRLDELNAIEAPAQRIWLVTTLERLLRLQDPGLYDHIKARYRLVARLPGTVGDGSIWIYGSSDFAPE